VDGVITENMLYPSASTVDSRQGKSHSSVFEILGFCVNTIF